MYKEFSLILMFMGALLLLLGLVMFFSDRLPHIKIFRLPGDINISKKIETEAGEKVQFHFSFPIVSCLILSLILSLLLSFFLGRK